jgi:hypothetical protein
MSVFLFSVCLFSNCYLSVFSSLPICLPTIFYLSSCLISHILSSIPSVHRLFSICIYDPSVTSLLCFACPLAILYLFLVSSFISSVYSLSVYILHSNFSSPFHLSTSYKLFSLFYVCLHASYFTSSSLFHLSPNYWLFSVCFMLHMSSSILCPVCPPAIAYSLSASRFICHLLFSAPSVLQLLAILCLLHASSAIFYSLPHLSSSYWLFSVCFMLHMSSLLCPICPPDIGSSLSVSCFICHLLFSAPSVLQLLPILCLLHASSVALSSLFHLSSSYKLFYVCLYASSFTSSSLFHLSTSYWLFSVCFMLHLSFLLCPICPRSSNYALPVFMFLCLFLYTFCPPLLLCLSSCFICHRLFSAPSVKLSFSIFFIVFYVTSSDMLVSRLWPFSINCICINCLATEHISYLHTLHKSILYFSVKLC